MCRFLVWGTGNDAVRYGAFLEKMELKEAEIIGYLDSDVRKRGGQFLGKKVFAPEELNTLDYDYITIWSSKFYDEIYQQAVCEYGIAPERIKDVLTLYKQKLEKKYEGTDDPALKEILRRILEQSGLSVFYFEPDRKDVWNEVFFDEEAQLHYLFFEGKRMYLKKNFHGIEERDGKKYVGNMYGDQDTNSPHKYEGMGVAVEEGDILVDAGVCEGNFSLHHIDKVSKVYLIECDRGWMEALYHTFKPYKDKVVFCEKFLSNMDSEETVKLDTLVTEPVNFIKMDIEGEEIRALEGGRKLLTDSEEIKCSICVYHHHGDEERIKGLLDGMGFETDTSDGYMLFLYDDAVLRDPELRRGVVRGRKGSVQRSAS